MSLAAGSISLSQTDDLSKISSVSPLLDQRGAHFDIPCFRSAQLSIAFGAEISICDVTLGPTSSWKDCVAPGVIEAAQRQGLRGVVVASSGNHGRAIAFACRVAGLETAVLVYDRTPPDVVASLIALKADVFRFSDRAAVHAAMDRFIADGWFSATLPDRLRNSSSMPGGDGYKRIATSIARAVDGNPIVVVPTCYGDGATAIRRHLVQLGRRPIMCLVRATEAAGGVAASIATDVVTPQVSRMLVDGAVNILVDNKSVLDGIETMEAAVGKPLDFAEGGVPKALAKLVAGGASSICESIVCVLTGGLFAGLNHGRRT